MSRLDGAGEGSLVSIETGENILKEGLRRITIERNLAFAIAVELEKLREQGKNESKGNLSRVC